MEAAEAGVWQPRCNRWPLMARGGNWNGEIHRRPEAGACRALETWNGFSSSWKPVLEVMWRYEVEAEELRDKVRRGCVPGRKPNGPETCRQYRGASSASRQTVRVWDLLTPSWRSSRYLDL